MEPEQEPTDGKCVLLQPLVEQKQNDKQAAGRTTSYRIVFTMKRMMTARPTQPHITPMTMAVTSPAAENTKEARKFKASVT